jgi:hypothetical protein
MQKQFPHSMRRQLNRFALFAIAAAFGAAPGFAQQFQPGNLVVSRSTYEGTAATVMVGQNLPPGCVTGSASCVQAVNNGAYPNVFLNAPVDGSFGVTSPIFLDQMTTGGQLINTMTVNPTQIVTSFSSKSELAVNLSTDGTTLTFMGYTLGSANTTTMINDLDASNSNTPGLIDPTNPVVGTAFFRGVAAVDANGDLNVTNTNSFSGDNSRAAILANGLYYTVGNDNNGSEPTKAPIGTVLQNLVLATGSQIVVPGQNASSLSSAQDPGTIQIGSFSVTQEGDAVDKPGKDNNFRGEAIFNNTLYVSKGSGSNGIDTVYQVGNAGSLPVVSGAIPNPPGTAAGYPITVLPGFPTALAKNAGINNIYPFGLWFANANTLYVGDEGDGVIADAPNSTFAGLQKWVLNNGTWSLAYVMQNGLNLGVQYGVAGYPPSLNPAPAGLRNITGRVNGDGTVTIWAITSTVSAAGDQGADPNQLVTITDVLANTNPATAASQQFTVLETASFGNVLRGVSFTPGTVANPPAPSLVVNTGGLIYSRVSKTFSATVTVLNNSSNTVSGPVSVEFSNLSSNVTMVSTNPLPVLTSGSSLAPGQSATATVVFSAPIGTQITFNTAVVQ